MELSSSNISKKTGTIKTDNTIPVIVGVTGHRIVRKEDYGAIYAAVKKELEKRFIQLQMVLYLEYQNSSTSPLDDSLYHPPDEGNPQSLCLPVWNLHTDFQL